MTSGHPITEASDHARPISSPTASISARSTVLMLIGVVLLGTALRLALVFTSFGSDDVHIFEVFARQIARIGPLRMYGVSSPFPYNHAPVTGWLLDGLQWVSRHGFSFPVGLRLVPVAADAGSAVLAYSVTSPRYGRARGVIAAALIALNPVAVFISGFHGNVDSIAFFFALLGFWLAVDRQRLALSGAAAAVGIGVKIVPVVALPILLAFAIRSGRGRRFIEGFMATSTIIWLPALVASRSVVSKVLGYSGGTSHVLAWAALAIAIAAGLAVDHRQSSPYRGAAVATLGLLLLSPAWAPQYLVWPVAFGALSFQESLAALYALIAGTFLFETYTRWSGGFPWHRAFGRLGLDLAGRILLAATWAGVLIWIGVIVRARTPQGGPRGRAPSTLHDVAGSARPDFQVEG